MKLAIIHRRDFTNLGDIYSSPDLLLRKYFEINNLSFPPVRTFDIGSLSKSLKSLKSFNPSHVIIGGGGLLTNSPCWLPAITSLARDYNSSIFGAGFNNMFKQSDIEKIATSGFANIYVRDYIPSFQHIECPSVIRLLSSIPSCDNNFIGFGGNRVLLAFHKSRKHIKSNYAAYDFLIKYFSDRIFDFHTNLFYPSAFSALVKKILRCGTIISSSYHVCLWGLLLKKNVFFFSTKNSFKFESISHLGGKLIDFNSSDGIHLSSLHASSTFEPIRYSTMDIKTSLNKLVESQLTALDFILR